MFINTRFDIGQKVYYILDNMTIRSGNICAIKIEAIRLNENSNYITTIYMLDGGGRYYNETELFKEITDALDSVKRFAITMNEL